MKKKAIIYVRGRNKEMQEVRCRLYAAQKEYKILFVTTDLKNVNNCDVLLVSNSSRISRDKFEYYKVLNELKDKHIVLESVTGQSEESFDNFVMYFRKGR